MSSVIILFAKAPLAGRVKTRLVPRFNTREAAALHEAFAADMLEMLESIRTQADVELHTDVLTDAWGEATVTRRLQASGDLGARMLHAMGAALGSGYDRALILGSDAPTLPAGHVLELLASSADVTLGPAGDGGYYAIASRRVHPDMFQGVEWSTERTLDGTMNAVQACGLTVELGPAWYDIDSPSDIDKLMEAPLPRHTRAAFGR